MKGVSLVDYVTDDIRDGVEGLNIHGVPKSGKSNMATGICDQLMNAYGENLIIPGDLNCEWRHFVSNKSVDDYIVLIPEELEGNIELLNVDKSHLDYIDYSELDIKNHLLMKDESEKTNFMLVIYDAHFQGSEFYRKIVLWNKIAKQLIRRTYLLYTPIILLFHEAGVYFPQISIGKHFEEIYNFSQYLVDFRKSKIRAILISQLDSEIVNTIWYKNYWSIYRKGRYSKRVPSDIRDQTPFYGITKYCISHGNLYTPNNIVKKYNECSDMWKMINTIDVEEGKNGNNGVLLSWNEANTITKKHNEGMSIPQIAEEKGTERQTENVNYNRGMKKIKDYVSTYVHTPTIN